MSSFETQVKDAVTKVLSTYEIAGEASAGLVDDLVNSIVEATAKHRPAVSVKQKVAASADSDGGSKGKSKGKGSRAGTGNYYSKFLSLVSKLDTDSSTNYESVDDSGLTFRPPEKQPAKHDAYMKDLESSPDVMSEDFVYPTVRELYDALRTKFNKKERMWLTAVMWTYYVSPVDKKNWQELHPASSK